MNNPGVTSSDERDELVAQLNAMVAIDYNLDRNQIIQLMKSAETPNSIREVRREAQRIVDCFDTLTKKDSAND